MNRSSCSPKHPFSQQPQHHHRHPPAVQTNVKISESSLLKYRESRHEKTYRQALKRYEKAVGLKHTSTLHTVNNLDLLCANQGKIVEAEEMYMRTVRGYEKAREPEHTSTLDTINNLGILYEDQGKMAEAEEMFVWVLKGSRKRPSENAKSCPQLMRLTCP
jgi:Tfp pilus assembly protein PilF